MSETAKMLHVNLAPGEAGRYAIVPGDPDRCELIAAHLDNPRTVSYTHLTLPTKRIV